VASASPCAASAAAGKETDPIRSAQ
jgi:hypothetical protein